MRAAGRLVRCPRRPRAPGRQCSPRVWRAENAPPGGFRSARTRAGASSGLPRSSFLLGRAADCGEQLRPLGDLGRDFEFDAVRDCDPVFLDEVPLEDADAAFERGLAARRVAPRPGRARPPRAAPPAAARRLRRGSPGTAPGRARSSRRGAARPSGQGPLRPRLRRRRRSPGRRARRRAAGGTPPRACPRRRSTGPQSPRARPRRSRSRRVEAKGPRDRPTPCTRRVRRPPWRVAPARCAPPVRCGSGPCAPPASLQPASESKRDAKRDRPCSRSTDLRRPSRIHVKARPLQSRDRVVPECGRPATRYRRCERTLQDGTHLRARRNDAAARPAAQRTPFRRRGVEQPRPRPRTLARLRRCGGRRRLRCTEVPVVPDRRTLRAGSPGVQRRASRARGLGAARGVPSRARGARARARHRLRLHAISYRCSRGSARLGGFPEGRLLRTAVGRPPRRLCEDESSDRAFDRHGDCGRSVAQPARARRRRLSRPHPAALRLRLSDSTRARRIWPRSARCARSLPRGPASSCEPAGRTTARIRRSCCAPSTASARR